MVRRCGVGGVQWRGGGLGRREDVVGVVVFNGVELVWGGGKV